MATDFMGENHEMEKLENQFRPILLHRYVMQSDIDQKEETLIVLIFQ